MFIGIFTNKKIQFLFSSSLLFILFLWWVTLPPHWVHHIGKPVVSKVVVHYHKSNGRTEAHSHKKAHQTQIKYKHCLALLYSNDIFSDFLKKICITQQFFGSIKYQNAHEYSFRD